MTNQNDVDRRYSFVYTIYIGLNKYKQESFMKNVSTNFEKKKGQLTAVLAKLSADMAIF